MWKLCFVFLMASQLLSAQIKGYVLDRDKLPIAGATIYNKNQKKGSISANDGVFYLEYASQNDVLIVSSVGYKATIITVDSDLLSGKPYDVFLDPDQDLEEIIVTGNLQEVKKSESPIPVSMYSSTYFKSNPSPSIFEAMQLINGIRPQLNCNVCNTGDIHINGQEGANTMILIDGLPIVSGLATVYGLTGIPQELIEQVEVIKGPASTLYGSEAIGGVINLITKLPEKAPQMTLESYATSWGEINTDFGVRYRLGKSQALLGVNYFNYNQPIDNNNDNFTDLTLQHRVSVFHKITNSKNSVAMRFNYEDRWGGEMNWNPSFRGGTSRYGESIYTARWELFGRYQLKDDWFLQYSLNNHSQNAVYGDTDYLADQSIGFVQTVQTKKYQKGNRLLGFSYRLTSYDDNTPAMIKSNVTHLPGIFAQREWFINPNHTLLAGFRWDYNSIYKGIFTPRINYKWHNKQETSVFRLGGGTGYRIVNVFTEDHAALTGAREVIFEEELEPEQSWNLTLNWVQKIYTKRGHRITLDGNLFYTQFSNRILPDYDSNPNEIRYANLDSFAINKGVSMDTRGTLSNGLAFRFGVTWIDAQINQDGEIVRPILTESFSANYNISYRIRSLPLEWDWSGTIIGPMRLPLLGALDPRPSQSPWIHDTNLQFRWTESQIELFGGIKNILNFTPPDNSISRAFDPFDKQVTFNASGTPVATNNNPNALTFDPSYVFYSNQGRRLFVGIRYKIN